MTKNILKSNNKKNEYVIEWFPATKLPKLHPVTQVYGVCFNHSGQILIVKTTKNWQLPGGHPERGESYEETLKREVDEEGDIDIENLIPLGYQKVTRYTSRKKVFVFYQLRYFAKISRMKKQTIDPATERIPKRRFIEPKNFLNYCQWGKTGKAMMQAAMDTFTKENK